MDKLSSFVNRHDFSANREQLLMNKSNFIEFEPKRLGTILREADLVSTYQLDLALKDRVNFPDLRIGEILAMRGWIQPATADFFVRDWFKLVRESERQPLGQYLIQSALLKPEELINVLEEQKNTGIRCGTIAVMQGLLKSTTLDFFLANLFPKEVTVSPFINMCRPMSPLFPRPKIEYSEPSLYYEEWEDEVLWEEDLEELLEDIDDSETFLSDE